MKASGVSLVTARLPKETPEIDDAEPNITEVDGVATGDVAVHSLLLTLKLKPAKGLGLDVFASFCGLAVVPGFCSDANL